MPLRPGYTSPAPADPAASPEPLIADDAPRVYVVANTDYYDNYMVVAVYQDETEAQLHALRITEEGRDVDFGDVSVFPLL